MSQIVRNGVVYGGSPNNSKDIYYNNNSSDLESTNVQDAIDELDNEISSINTNLTNNSALIFAKVIQRNIEIKNNNVAEISFTGNDFELNVGDIPCHISVSYNQASVWRSMTIQTACVNSAITSLSDQIGAILFTNGRDVTINANCVITVFYKHIE